MCSEVSINSPGIRGVGPEKEKEGYNGGKSMKKKNNAAKYSVSRLCYAT